MIDWSKLKPYDTDQKRSFEELCYQVARVKFGEKGIFTSVDDSGGGDGVEFYLTLPTGEEWGWQAKFYLEGRLNSSRKQQIKKSLVKSLEVHKKLKRWYLCIPMELTPNEKAWFEKVLKEIVPSTVDLYFWGESEFNYYLGTPDFAGRKNYFFGELELTYEWFSTQVSNQLSAIEGKYNPYVHTQTDIDLEIDSLMLNDGYIEYIQKQKESLNELIGKIEPALAEINQIETSIIPLTIKKDYIKCLDKIWDTFRGSSSLLEEEISSVKCKDILRNPVSPYTGMLEKLNIYMIEFREKYFGISEDYLKLSVGMEEIEVQKIRNLRNKLWKPFEVFEEIYQDFKTTVDRILRSRENSLHMFGNAGLGKTHVSAHVANKTIQKGLPAIFILGNNIIDNRMLSEQLLANLDIPKNYSWSDFLKALDVAGKAFRTKIPIFIDGLNEVRDIGVVKNGIPSLVKEISSFDNICLITTCRNTYINPIFGKPPVNSVYMYGFSNESLVEAVNLYFDYYKIKADISTASLETFEHPLYLQIFCQTKNPRREYEQEVFINEQSMFDIFEEYLLRCNENISERLNFNPKRKIIIKKLNNLGEVLWERNSRSLSIEEAEGVLEHSQTVNWNNSIEKNLMDENLLIYRDWHQDEGDEVITFTYDLLGGYIIAKHLLTKHRERLSEFLNDHNTVKLLFGEDYQSRHPLYEDISRCIAALLPLYSGDYLMNYIKNSTTVNLTVHAFFEMTPESINSKAKDIIETLFAKSSNRKNLFNIGEKTFRQVGHPLNIYFWSMLLKELGMAERDISWSEHIRKNNREIEKTINMLLQRCEGKRSEFGSYDRDFLYLLAENVMWILTSTVKSIRDRATRALYYFGRLFPEKFFELVRFSFSLNDPYICERMLAALYGIGMAKHYDFNDKGFTLNILPEMAKVIFNLMFAEEAKYFTTHVLTRDYGRSFIEIALIHHPQLLSADEKEKLYPPFNHVNKMVWKSKEKGEDTDYGSNPIKMDFGNYTIGRLIKNRSNYDYEHEEYKRVRSQIYWRIYDLGYSTELFNKIDDEIERGNFNFGRSNDGGKIDRYGKKYSWIAYFEIAGHLDDDGLIDDDFHTEKYRTSDIDIDPSFPVDIKEVQIVKRNYLGENLPAYDWLFGNCVPNFKDYLVVEEIDGLEGPWVLLDGYFSDENQSQTRSCFFFPRGLLVKNSDLEKATHLLRKQNLGGRWLPEVPTDNYVYTGEIPWSYMCTENKITQLEFVTEKEVETYQAEKKVLVKDGQELTINQKLELMERLKKDGKSNLISQIIYGLGEIQHEEFDLEKYGLEIETEIIEKESIKKETDRLGVLIPVRENSWEGDGSIIIPGRNVSIPCKELIYTLGLISQPQTFDLYEKCGRKGSISITYGSGYSKRQKFTYIRKDLLDKFLEKEGYQLIWALWGEKEISHKGKKFREYFDEEYGEIRKDFKDIIVYQRVN